MVCSVFPFFSILFPLADGCLPVGKLLGVVLFAGRLNLGEQFVFRRQGICVLAAPFFGEFAVKGVFEQGLAVLLDLLRCGFQTTYAFVDFVNRLSIFIDDGLCWVSSGGMGYF